MKKKAVLHGNDEFGTYKRSTYTVGGLIDELKKHPLDMPVAGLWDGWPAPLYSIGVSDEFFKEKVLCLDVSIH